MAEVIFLDHDFRHISSGRLSAILLFVQQGLPSSPAYHRLLRFAGIGTWLFLGLPILDSTTRIGESFTRGEWIAWLCLFLFFGPAFWFSSSPRPRPYFLRLAGLLCETASVLGMTYFHQDYFVGFLLVMVSWQAALCLPLRVAATWAAAASALWIGFLHPNYHLGWRWSASGALLGFQVFAIATAAMARREALAREEQARINADLVSTRELLRESSRTSERIRISRDLHDLLGHHLTALCLQLEAAIHSPPAEARGFVEKAHKEARQSLEDVRSVVSGLHQAEEIDLRSALCGLAENVPRIRLHLTVPADFCIADCARAQAVLRCVQEITTNTLKHSDATNLWIEFRQVLGTIEIDARDDGNALAPAASGIGIASMRRRLEEFGGGLTVVSSRAPGFALRAWIPVEKATAGAQ